MAFNELVGYIFIAMIIISAFSFCIYIKISEKKWIEKANIRLISYKKGKCRYLIDMNIKFIYNEAYKETIYTASCYSILTGDLGFGCRQEEYMNRFNNLTEKEKFTALEKHARRRTEWILLETKDKEREKQANKAWDDLPEQF